MSFFDEADEPRTAPRTRPRRPRQSGRGRPPGDQQAIQNRRIVAGIGLVVFVIVCGILINSCQVSARNNALKDYNANVATVMQESVSTGQQLFRELSSGRGSTSASTIQTEIDQTRVDAQKELTKARGFDLPGEMSAAQQNVLLALRMRRDGITTIGNEIQPALGTSTNKDALSKLAAANATFYASDVVYKSYALPEIVGALHAAGIGVGGTNGQTVFSGQFVPDLGWLQPSFVATKLGASVPASLTKPTPGLHGHVLNGATIAGATLSTSANNSVPASPPATLTLNLTNGGQSDEHNVVCKVTVVGTSVSGTQTIPTTTAGQSASCNVTLGSAPTPGTYNVTATVQPVPGEKNTANNSLTFPVTFK